MAKKAKKAKPAKPEKPEPKIPRRPRDVALPGMEDRAITEVDELVAQRDDVRTERAALLRREEQILVKIRTTMKKHSKSIYARNGIEVRLVPGTERVKVKVHRLRGQLKSPEPLSELGPD